MPSRPILSLTAEALTKIKGAVPNEQVHSTLGSLHRLWGLALSPRALYLRGSSAASQSSVLPLDLDLYLIESGERRQYIDIESLNNSLRHEFENLPVLDISYVSLRSLSDINKRLMTRLILKHEGVLAHGDDIRDALPEDRLDKSAAMSISFKQTLIVERKIKRVLSDGALMSGNLSGLNIYMLKSVAKSALRLATPLYIISDSAFIRDTRRCRDILIQQRPELDQDVSRLFLTLSGEERSGRKIVSSAIAVYNAFNFQSLFPAQT